MATQAQAPREVSAGPGRTYRLDERHHAEHGRERGAPAPGAVLVLDGGRIAVFRGPRAPARGGAEIGPVYVSADGGMVVPTGLVFVRFAEGTAAGERRADLEGAGFEVAQLPGYAPHAAWVRARSGGIAASLAQLPRLRAIPGVEHVEPQMSMERVAR